MLIMLTHTQPVLLSTCLQMALLCLHAKMTQACKITQTRKMTQGECLPCARPACYFYYGGIFALRAHCALLLDYVPPEEPPSTPLGNALRIR